MAHATPLNIASLEKSKRLKYIYQKGSSGKWAKQ